MQLLFISQPAVNKRIRCKRKYNNQGVHFYIEKYCLDELNDNNMPLHKWRVWETKEKIICGGTDDEG